MTHNFLKSLQIWSQHGDFSTKTPFRALPRKENPLQTTRKDQAPHHTENVQKNSNHYTRPSQTRRAMSPHPLPCRCQGDERDARPKPKTPPHERGSSRTKRRGCYIAVPSRSVFGAPSPLFPRPDPVFSNKRYRKNFVVSRMCVRI